MQTTPCLLALVALVATAPPAQARQLRSSELLAMLPDGVEKRRFILDCTGCHQFDSVTARPRSRAEWADAVQRMLGFAGATSNFPVISDYRQAGPTAEWLAAAQGTPGGRPESGRIEEGRADIREYTMSSPGDLLHDVAVDSAGMIVVTGMFSGAMYHLEPNSGAVQRIATPSGGARAIELDANGNWWVLLGTPPTLAVYDVDERTWRAPVRLPAYPHSIGLGRDGRAWFNGHFTHDPELIGSVRGAEVQTFAVPRHPTMAPTPYELRVGPDGRVWMSELHGNRIIGYTPATARFETFELPTPFSGPRRFDLDHQGILWIPAYAGNALVRLDPATGRFEEFPFPEPDVLPYVARVDHGTGAIWIGTAAADAAYRFDPRTGRFTRYLLPSRGALVRHIAIDPRSHDVWLAYGASPGRITARIARLRAQP